MNRWIADIHLKNELIEPEVLSSLFQSGFACGTIYSPTEVNLRLMHNCVCRLSTGKNTFWFILGYLMI